MCMNRMNLYISFLCSVCARACEWCVSGVCCPRAECRPLDVGGCAHAVICGGTLVVLWTTINSGRQ